MMNMANVVEGNEIIFLYDYFKEGKKRVYDGTIDFVLPWGDTIYVAFFEDFKRPIVKISRKDILGYYDEDGTARNLDGSLYHPAQISA